MDICPSAEQHLTVTDKGMASRGQICLCLAIKYACLSVPCHLFARCYNTVLLMIDLQSTTSNTTKRILRCMT